MAQFRNGEIPQSVLKQFGATGKYGHPAFVDHLTAAFAAVLKETGYKLYIATDQDLYRDLAGQRFWKAYWTARGLPWNAAAIGTSNHGWARSADVSGLPPQGSWARAAVDRILARFGLFFDTHEAWHLTDKTIPINSNNTVTLGAPAPVVPAAPKPTPIPKPEEVDVLSDADKKLMTTIAEDADKTKQAVARLEAKLVGEGEYTVEKNLATTKEAVARIERLTNTISNGVGKLLAKLGVK